MSVDTPDTNTATRSLIRRLKWTRFVVRLVGGLAVLMGGGLVAVSVFVISDRPAQVNHATGWVTSAFVLDAVIGIGLLVPLDIARAWGRVWFLAWGLFLALGCALLLAMMWRSDIRAFLMGGAWLAALHIVSAIALFSTRATFVCRYLGARRVGDDAVLEALRRALSDRSAAVRRFAVRELERAGVAPPAPMSETSKAGDLT